MSAPDVRLTRNNCGLARLPLIGGRFDGAERVAIIGAPICIFVQPDKAGDGAPAGSSYLLAMQKMFGVGGDVVEGDEWKLKPPTAGATKKVERFALYAPKIENGRASLALYFIEEVEL